MQVVDPEEARCAVVEVELVGAAEEHQEVEGALATEEGEEVLREGVREGADSALGEGGGVIQISQGPALGDEDHDLRARR